MTDLIRLSGIALLALFSVLILREKYKLAGTAVIFIAFVLVSVYSIKGRITEAVGTVGTYLANTGFSDYAITLMKALGIGYITSITETICSDAGENTLAAAVELAGKAQLILLSLPLILSLLEVASQFL